MNGTTVWLACVGFGVLVVGLWVGFALGYLLAAAVAVARQADRPAAAPRPDGRLWRRYSRPAAERCAFAGRRRPAGVARAHRVPQSCT